MDYSRFKGRLPYASEMFGTYRPMIGWASKRKADRIIAASANAVPSLLTGLLPGYESRNQFWGPAGEIPRLSHAEIGVPVGEARLQLTNMSEGSFLLPALQELIAERRGNFSPPQNIDEWREVVGEDALRTTFGHTAGAGEIATGVVAAWELWSETFVREQLRTVNKKPGETDNEFDVRKSEFGMHLWATANDVLDRESAMAGVILGLLDAGATDTLQALFYKPAPNAKALEAKMKAIQDRLSNPFLEFDPTDKLTGASVSPIGIVHLFRQYFFEFDTFLGPAVGHVWLTPGSTVELVESSTRKTTVERTYETEFETRTQTERSDKSQDDISDAIKQENRQDTKLGFGATVNQSWPAGSLTATTSINLDTTQQEAREHTQKRMREQSEKISTDIRNSYKTTFRTVTETTDVSTKRYVLENKSPDKLQNYEMRRKMRQVGVQVQDIGSYLCWESFVDDPGAGLGLANLVHIAKPPDTTPPPTPGTIDLPPRKPDIPFDVKVAWGGPKESQKNTTKQGVPLGRRQIAIDIPDGYMLELTEGQVIQLQCLAASGEGAEGFRHGQWLAVYAGNKEIDVGYVVGPGGLRWDHFVGCDLRGTVALVPTPDRVKAIQDQNKAILANAEHAAQIASDKATEASFYDAAKERIEIAGAIKKRSFDDLREEERTVVYRALIADLMAKDAKTNVPNYDGVTPEQRDSVTPEQRHLYATVINSIFDIDKMLYFVAPEWWKPRPRTQLRLGDHPTGSPTTFPAGKTVSWSDNQDREDNYYITANSEPARLGSSLGWLLQLDGDDNRNRFLNAPWVRSVIPIRPGMETAAINWLTKADVEGVEGLNDRYAARAGEADEIKAGLKAASLPCSDPPTVADAIRYLCLRIEEKHDEGNTEKLFPNRDGINDADKVWSTPIEKVYEHGFYPLERSFRASPIEEPADSTSPNFQIMSQWTEILPTDQIVPVPVEYNPITGRMIDPEEP